MRKIVGYNVKNINIIAKTNWKSDTIFIRLKLLWEVIIYMSSVAMLIPFLVIYVPLLGASIYAFILFIKLARRGIKALDIYPIASIRNSPTYLSGR